MTSLKNKTIFISGGSRGIGLEIAKRAARDGANIAIAAKTAEPIQLYLEQYIQRPTRSLKLVVKHFLFYVIFVSRSR